MLNLVIVPDENIMECEEKIINYNNIDLLDGHISAMYDFIEKNNIDIPNYKSKSSYGLSCALLEFGCMNIHFEDKFALVYLPYTISDNQYKYIKENLKILSKFSLSMASLNQNGEIDTYDNTDEESINMSTLLMKLVKRKVQIRKYLESKENEKRI